jgi:ubiquinol-cytochrome c reductase iron-sulfur subunit
MSERRDFFGKTLGAFAGLGALGALYAAKRTWDPLPSVKAGGFTTVDVSAAQENVLVTEMWRGKPIFILKVGKDDKKAYSNKRLVEIGGDKFLIAIGLCTHLGCIPAYFGEEHKFKCACHGGEFDAAGKDIKLPPPSPLVIPPFKIDGKKLVLGEEGPEFQKLKADGLIA